MVTLAGKDRAAFWKRIDALGTPRSRLLPLHKRKGAQWVKPGLVATVRHLRGEEKLRGEGARAGWTHEADMLSGQRTDVAMLEGLLSDPARMIFVADEGSVLVGCVEAADQDGIAYIGLLTVEPSRQGGGLGRRLAEAAEAFARGRGLTMAKMTVIAIRSELIAWYERLGYKRTGSCAAFPAHDPRFGTPLRTDLEFVVLEKTL